MRIITGTVTNRAAMFGPVVVLIASFSAAIVNGCATDPAPPDNLHPSLPTTIYENGRVLTMDPDRPEAAAVVVAGDRIVAVYDGAVPSSVDGQRVDLDGATVLPGLTDAHLHLRGLGASARMLDLRDTGSAEQIADMVRRAAETAPEGTWIRGRGWDQNDWDDKVFPTHHVLDEAAPKHKVWLTRIDGHAVWVSKSAMDAAGVTGETRSPSGGEIVADEGEPTGVFVDNAIGLLTDQLPPTSAEEVRADLLAGIERCHQAGLTGVHDMGTSPAVLSELRRLEDEGKLGLRVHVYLGGAPSQLAPLLAEPPDRDGLVRVVGVKLFADGALGSRGAALLAPYSDRPETSGLLVTGEEVLRERVAEVDAAGYQVAIHAIGDRGNRSALDAIAALGDRKGALSPRIEHAQVIALDDIPRFATLGVVASMQPTHATSDMPWAEARVGPERIKGAYAWRTLLDNDIVLALGSDAPVERENPWLGVYAAVARTDSKGSPAGGWYPQQRLTAFEALYGFTRAPALVVGADDLGVIREGALADLTIVDLDPKTTPVELKDVRTLRTIVAGRDVYAAAP